MATQPTLVTEQPRSPHLAAIVHDFLALQEHNRGTELAQVLTDDAVLDLNVPQWRFQVGGALPIAAAFAQSFSAGFRTLSSAWEETSTGALVEYDGRDAADDRYYRHLARLTMRGERIARVTIYCTGAWDADTLDRQRREAPMVDDEQTGAGR